MRTALLVIHVQKDYFPGGKCPLEGALEAAQRAGMLLQCFREHGGRHVHVQHIALEAGATCLQRGETGSDIHDATPHFVEEPIVYTHQPNAFQDTDLLDMLRGWQVERVVVTGMGVDISARAAAELGFAVIVVGDACASEALEYEEGKIPKYAMVMKAEAVLALLAAEMVQGL